ncbi:Uncharacterized protein APZ42_003042 [Daphnia magna]|uniref:Uncharacterized protein n=1 Tax=Daphnia magna TaxID=35525 RepID=A0A164HVG1_9CRUS|nr:Uncharacterized protein APZ42_003042 [Daphnia magna]
MIQFPPRASSAFYFRSLWTGLLYSVFQMDSVYILVGGIFELLEISVFTHLFLFLSVLLFELCLFWKQEWQRAIEKETIDENDFQRR